MNLFRTFRNYMFLARGVRRLQKKLNKHILDKEAHKEPEQEE